MKSLRNPLLELLVCVNFVSNDADHHSQLVHHLLLLLVLHLHGQRRKERGVV